VFILNCNNLLKLLTLLNRFLDSFFHDIFSLLEYLWVFVQVQMESSKEWVYISSYLEEQIYNEYLQYTEPSICRCYSINATTISSSTTTTCESNLPFVLPVQCIDQTKLNLSSYDLCKFICSWRCSGEIVRNGMKQFETLKGHNFGIFLKSMLMRIISTNNISAVRVLCFSNIYVTALFHFFEIWL